MITETLIRLKPPPAGPGNCALCGEALSRWRRPVTLRLCESCRLYRPSFSRRRSALGDRVGYRDLPRDFFMHFHEAESVLLNLEMECETRPTTPA